MSVRLSNKDLTNVIKHWGYIAPLVMPPKNTEEYNKLVLMLDGLLDKVGDYENHQLNPLIEFISHLISTYDEAHYPEPRKKGLAALKYLIKANNLRQSDLKDIGSQGVMSEILSGKRKLNMRQIRLLSKRFHVNPATFID